MATQFATMAGRLNRPLLGIPRWVFVVALVIALAFGVGLAIRSIVASNVGATPSVAVPAAQAAPPPANNIQRLGPAAFRDTPEAKLGQQALDGSFPYAFTDKFTGAAALQACKRMISKKTGGNPTNTILQGTSMNGAIASITWKHALRDAFYPEKTATGEITLGFTRVAGEPKISSVSC